MAETPYHSQFNEEPNEVLCKALEWRILRPFLGSLYCFHGHFWEIRCSVKGILVEYFDIIDF